MRPTHHARALGIALALPAVMALGNAQAIAQEQEQRQEERQQEQQYERADQEQQGQSLIELAREREELSTFVKAVQIAGLEGELREGGPYTVFAPTNQAFESHFSQEELDRLTGGQQPEAGDEASRNELLRFLRAHIVPGQWTVEELQGTRTIANVLGDQLAVTSGEAEEETMAAATTEREQKQETEEVERTEREQAEAIEPAGRRIGASDVEVEGVSIVEADIRASNGILHRIDGAIEPEPAQETTDPQKQREEGDEPPR